MESVLSSKAVLQSLKNEGLIRDSSLGYLYAKNNHLTNIKAGDYTLNKNMDLKTILTTINDASKAISYDVSVTVVEGDWAKHIADKISAVTNVSSDELLSLWNNEDYIRSIMDKYPFLTDEIFNDNIRIIYWIYKLIYGFCFSKMGNTCTSIFTNVYESWYITRTYSSCL